jgi:hypothetical protein
MALPLLPLFMHGMQYRGVLATAVGGTGATAALIYALRSKPGAMAERSSDWES